MRIEDFKSGRYVRKFEYRCFVPEPINHDWTWESRALTVAFERAVKALAGLDACSQFVPDVNLFIRMHVVREASASSRIEGTRTELEEAVLPERAVAEERRDDWREVNNYVAAMDWALDELQRLPLSIRLLRGAHARLLEGVRGEHKFPGEVRTSQNWIGGASIASARYVPPSPEFLPDLLGDLEMFWHNDRIEVPHLVRCAISHYQFETIHPFCDGNGRVGRLLIPFYLIGKGELALPSLYVSSTLERHRWAYYEALSRVRETNDLAGWIVFFLDAVAETARTGCAKFKRIFALRDEMREYTRRISPTAAAQRLLLHLYREPRVTIQQAAAALECDYQGARRLVRRFVADGILVEADGPRRNVIYDFRRYLDLFKDE